MKYDQKTILHAIEKGVPFHFDFEERTLRLGKKKLNAEEIDTSGFDTEDPIPRLEKLYALYRKSIPSQRNDSKKSRYFIALPEKELSDEDLMYGEDRESAQGRLELHVLLCILTNAIDWNLNESFKGKWFWKSPNDPHLVLLRSWFLPEQKNIITATNN